MDQPSADDLARMRDETVGNVDFDVTDEQLLQVWLDDPHLVALAREWGWGDTEVRDQLCAYLEALGARPPAPRQPVTVGLRVDVATYPHRRPETQDPAASPSIAELTDRIEQAIVRSEKVRAAGGAVVVSLTDRPQEAPQLADTAMALRVDVTVTASRWSADNETQLLSEQVRAHVADVLGVVEQAAGAVTTVNVVNLVYGTDREELPR
ncbi:hypothetical protein GCM10027258_79970 [Amycolatopsis stemonae]